MANWSTNGYDLHLVAPVDQPNRTFQLANFFVPNPGQTWTFTSVFTPLTGTLHGVELAANGQLTFFQGTAAVRNFIVNAVHGTDPPVPIRIHRHDQLDSVELTPTRLTLHQASSARFSILAVFRDRVDGTNFPCVADISQQPGLTWAVSSGPVTMNATRPGFVDAGPGPGTGTAAVQVTLPADLFPVGATPLPPLVGNIQLAPDWSTRLPDAITWVAGPGFPQIDDVPNILILPDGFPNRTEFENAARAMINKVRTSPTAAPWNMFLAPTPTVLQSPTPQQRPWVNVWMAWVPSPEEGGNVLTELRPRPPMSSFVPPPVALAPTASIATVEHLIYRVGLPTLADGARPDLNAQMDIWKNLYSQTYLAGITTKLWQKWKDLAVRVLARERDTTFGISLGGRPQLPRKSPSSITLNPFRATRDNVNSLVSQLFVATAAQGNVTVGNRWSTGGKDRDYVVILSKGASERGTHGAVVAMTITGQDRPALDIVPPLVSGIATLQIPPVPAEPVTAAATFAHELTHSFHAGDEYAGGGFGLPAVNVDFTQRSYWNLLVDREVRDTASRLSVDRMRWSQWPRVAAANFIVGRPTVTETVPFDRIVVQLRPGGTQPFQDVLDRGRIDKDSDIFKLRQRPLVTFTTVGGTQVPRPQSELVSPAMKLVSIDPTNNRINLDEVVNGALRAWMAGLPSTDTEPLRLLAIELDTSGGERPVLHPAIGAHIVGHGTGGRPLNRAFNAENACVLDKNGTAVQLPNGLRDFPTTGVRLPPVPSRVIGIYDGGATYSCEVYHPAGACKMRTELSVPELDPLTDLPPPEQRKTVAATFCHVCRYLLVEQIAPVFHDEIDRLYILNYPQ